MLTSTQAKLHLAIHAHCGPHTTMLEAWSGLKSSQSCQGHLGNPWGQGTGLLGVDRVGFTWLHGEGGSGLPRWEGRCTESTVHKGQRLDEWELSLGIGAWKAVCETP